MDKLERKVNKSADAIDELKNNQAQLKMEFRAANSISTNREQTGNNLLVAPSANGLVKNQPELSSQTQAGRLELANSIAKNRIATIKTGESLSLDSSKPDLDNWSQSAMTARVSHTLDAVSYTHLTLPTICSV